MAEDMSESEYSAQFYGFTPESFFKDFSEEILDEMSTIVQHSIKVMSSPNSKDGNKEELIKNSLEVHDEWSQQVEVVLKQLQPTIKEFFTIPKNVILPMYSQYEKDYSEDDIKKLESQVKQLEEDCRKQVTEIQMYKKELALLENVEPLQKKADEAVNYLKQVKENVSEVKELDKLLQYYQKTLQKLSLTQDNGDDKTLQKLSLTQDNGDDNNDHAVEENYNQFKHDDMFKTTTTSQ